MSTEPAYFAPLPCCSELTQPIVLVANLIVFSGKLNNLASVIYLADRSCYGGACGLRGIICAAFLGFCAPVHQDTCDGRFIEAVMMQMYRDGIIQSASINHVH